MKNNNNWEFIDCFQRFKAALQLKSLRRKKEKKRKKKSMAERINMARCLQTRMKDKLNLNCSGTVRQEGGKVRRTGWS